MIIHYGYEGLNIKLPVVTLGIFDGVHRGHRMLLDHLVRRAAEKGGSSVVVTLSPHPRLVLEKDHLDLAFLTTLDEKKGLLEKAGIDHLVIINFSSEFSRIPACDFVRDILVGKVGTRHLVVGYDHHFGRSGEGDFETIRQCSGLMDFRIEQLEGLETAEGAISSTLIREALLSGRLDDANNLLGYNYSLSGMVVEGKKIGRSMGFPTANISPEVHKLIPANGVYAVEVLFGKNSFAGMLSIGTNPTINSGKGLRSIEVNILNFDRDIYGEVVTVVFRKRLRDEKKFDNISQLVDQMHIDKEETLKIIH